MEYEKIFFKTSKVLDKVFKNVHSQIFLYDFKI